MKKTVQDLHKQYDIYGDKIKLYLVHQYDNKIKSWKFTGYQCIYCGSNMKYASSIDKHSELCRELTKTTTRRVNAEQYENVLSKDRTKWDPQYEQYSKKII